MRTACLQHVYCRYGELEGRDLGVQMGTVVLPDVATEDSEAVVAGLASSMDAAAQHVESAVQRCRKLTGALQSLTQCSMH